MLYYYNVLLGYLLLFSILHLDHRVWGVGVGIHPVFGRLAHDLSLHSHLFPLGFHDTTTVLFITFGSWSAKDMVASVTTISDYTLEDTTCLAILQSP
jgi:hypothetical protein